MATLLHIGALYVLAWSSWCISGLWLDAAVFRRLLDARGRALILPLTGAVWQAILLCNLSFLGLPARRGVWLAGGISLALWLAVSKGRPKVSARLIFVSWAVSLPIVAFHCAPLLKTGVLTTIGKDNGDWATYVSHAEWWKDHAYSDTLPPGRGTTVYNAVAQYRNGRFRIGVSQLFAGFAAQTGVRPMYSFTVFAALLVALAGLSMAVFLYCLPGAGLVASVAGGLLFAVHPLTQWIAYGAFLPQTFGTAVMLMAVLAGWELLAKPRALSRMIWLAFMTAGLMLCYNELLPLTAAVIVLCAVWRLTRGAALVPLLRGAAIAAALAFAISPYGFVLGIEGVANQVRLASSSGGGPQAVEHPLYFGATVAGLLPAPPVPDGYLLWKHRAVYPIIRLEFALLLLFAAGAVYFSRNEAGVVFIAGLASCLALACYIAISQASSPFRSWNLYKAAQYGVPFLFAALFAAPGSLASGKLRRGAAVLGTMFALHALCVSAAQCYMLCRYDFSGHGPRPGATVTRIEREFAEKVAAMPVGEPLVAGNPANASPASDPSSAALASAALLAYPRPVVPPDLAPELLSLHSFSCLVVDRLLPQLAIGGTEKLWSNERFEIHRIPPGFVQAAGAGAGSGTLADGSLLNVFRPARGSVVALHVFSPDAVQLGVFDAGAGRKLVASRVLGEALVLVPVEAAPGVRVLRLQMSGPAALIDMAALRGDAAVERATRYGAGLQAKQAAAPICIPLEPAGWSGVLLDQSVRGPACRFGASGVRLSSQEEVSGGVGYPVTLAAGWYALEMEFDGETEATGGGKGYGAAVLGLADGGWFTRHRGTHAVVKRVYVPRDGRYTVAMLLGGFGRAAGSATFRRLELAPVAPGGSPAAALRRTASMLGRLDSPAWSEAALKPGSSPPSLRRWSSQVVIGSAVATSYAWVNHLQVPAGSYLFHADLFADEDAAGPGWGYGAGILGEERNLVFFRSRGSHSVNTIVRCDKERSLPVALVLGGYGKNAGTVGFRNVTLRPVSTIIGQ